MIDWIELEDVYLTNQPTIYVRRKRVPDPEIPPTETYLFTRKCHRTKRGVVRKKVVVTLKADNENALNDAVAEFATRKDVVYLAPDGDEKHET